MLTELALFSALIVSVPNSSFNTSPHCQAADPKDLSHFAFGIKEAVQVRVPEIGTVLFVPDPKHASKAGTYLPIAFLNKTNHLFEFRSNLPRMRAHRDTLDSTHYWMSPDLTDRRWHQNLFGALRRSTEADWVHFSVTRDPCSLNHQPKDSLQRFDYDRYNHLMALMNRSIGEEKPTQRAWLYERLAEIMANPNYQRIIEIRSTGTDRLDPALPILLDSKLTESGLLTFTYKDSSNHLRRADIKCHAPATFSSLIAEINKLPGLQH